MFWIDGRIEVHRLLERLRLKRESRHLEKLSLLLIIKNVGFLFLSLDLRVSGWRREGEIRERIALLWRIDQRWRNRVICTIIGKEGLVVVGLRLGFGLLLGGFGGVGGINRRSAIDL